MKAGFERSHEIPLPFCRGIVPVSELSADACRAQQPVASVLMLAYRHEPYIARAIEGVLSQKTAFPIELLIGEDCSPDGTLQVALCYQRRFPSIIRVISSETNVGARWNAFRLEMSARGKYLAYCEADDYWHDPTKLQAQIDFLEANVHYGLVFTNADSLDVVTGERRPFAIPVRPELCDAQDPYTQQLTGAMHLWPLTVCVRTPLLHEILRECPEVTDPSYAMGDTPRFLELGRRCLFKYLPVSTATRQLLTESATRSADIARRARFVESSERLTLHYLEKYPLPPAIEQQVRSWVAHRGLYYAYLVNDRSKADQEVLLLRQHGIRVGRRHQLYYLGSRHPVLKLLVSAWLATLRNAATAKNWLSRTARRHREFAETGSKC